MKLQERIRLLSELGEYMAGSANGWQEVKQRAYDENHWFIPEFTGTAVENIIRQFLRKDILEKWALSYHLPDTNDHPVTVGIVMAGNIPLVGFHDLLSVLITGNKAIIKASGKDQALIKHLAGQLTKENTEFSTLISFAENLKGCEAYIATGSNTSSRYFEYYFGKYPNLIRRNKTSVAIVTGKETRAELEKLADDVYLYFGLGCRNVTKIYVPEGYDFLPMLEAFKKYEGLADHHQYKSNYDYRMALLILNKQVYMTNGSLILAENSHLFSPVSMLHYEFYRDKNSMLADLQNSPDLQCIVGEGSIPFGKSQEPAVNEYADGADTLQFLSTLPVLVHQH